MGQATAEPNDGNADDTPGEMARDLALDRYPRSARYDPGWVMEHRMGPNVLWLTEMLTEVLDLRPGMRVLDLGCGKALSSIFLAKEFGVQVWAADLWIPPSANWQRITAAGLGERVFPLRLEAHNLPFAEGFFDVIVSLDSFHYFGTADSYLLDLLPTLRPGGQLGVIVPGLRQELEQVPQALAPYWEPEYWTFHSPDWWRRHWDKLGTITVEVADAPETGWHDWLLWSEASLKWGDELPIDPDKTLNAKEAAMLRADDGRLLCFTRVVARKHQPSSPPSQPIPSE